MELITKFCFADDIHVQINDNVVRIAYVFYLFIHYYLFIYFSSLRSYEICKSVLNAFLNTDYIHYTAINHWTLSQSNILLNI